MHYARTLRRSTLIALTLLSACAASDPPSNAATGDLPSGVIGNYLAGRFALAEGDNTIAANDLLRALGQASGNEEMRNEAFLATLNAGRPEALTLARQLPDNQIAQFLLADADVKAGNWAAAEQRLHALPRQGITQLLQPLLLAWTQQGAGNTDAALATLRPYTENPRLQTVFSLHAGMIADVANRPRDAVRYYAAAAAGMGQPNLRTAEILGSFAARSGQPAEADRVLSMLPPAAPDLAIALPALMENMTKHPVSKPSEGLAEAYFTFAGVLQAQDADQVAMVMLRLALDLRPDFAPARLLAADLLENENRPQDGLKILADVPADDPVISLVRLRRAVLTDKAGHTDDALRELERMSRDYPNSPLPDEARGDLLRMQRHFAEAIPAYDKAIARIRVPQRYDWSVFYDRGVAEERTHQWPKAKADFDEALRLSPDQPYVLNYLGYSWADQGEHLNEARAMIEKAAQERPNDGAIVDSLGWVLLRQGHAAEAVKTLERAVELEPEDATINGHLGDAYDAVGRKIEALYQWRRALTLNPDADDKVRLQEKLSSRGIKTGAVVSDQ